MIFRFAIVSDENKTFRREIQIEADSTFLEFHKAILQSVGYADNQMTSFFVCDNEWERRQEISLVEMDTASDQDSYTMDSTRIEEFAQDKGQKFQYVFDTIADRAFYIELKEIITGKHLDAPVCTVSKGKAPKQSDDDLLNQDLFAGIEFEGNKAKNKKEDSFGGSYIDYDLNGDGYDEEDLDNLSQDISWDDNYER